MTVKRQLLMTTCQLPVHCVTARLLRFNCETTQLVYARITQSASSVIKYKHHPDTPPLFKIKNNMSLIYSKG